MCSFTYRPYILYLKFVNLKTDTSISLMIGCFEMPENPLHISIGGLNCTAFQFQLFFHNLPSSRSSKKQNEQETINGKQKLYILVN